MTITTSRFDLISTLPDALLCHILSFLPTKAAAATCVLSKRWTPLWLSVPTIHLEEQPYANDHEQLIHFLRTISAVMLKRHVTQPIKIFSLTLDVNSLCDSSDITTCVNAATQRGVEHLSLYLVPSPRIKLPSGIIGTKTLVFLRLSGLSVNGVFIDGFPSLKVLRLEYVCFQQHGHLMQLLSGCPILEDLHVENLMLSNGGDLITGGELYNLVSAVIFFAITCIPLKCLCNAKSLRIYEGFPNHEIACTFRNLTSLELLVDFYNWHWFLEVLQHCLKLQNLEIVKLDGAEEDDDFGDYRWVEPQFVPECLSSHLRTFVLRNYQGFDSELHLAKYIMQDAKVLCTMRIGSGIFSNPQAKLEFIKKMSSFPWSSATCELYLIEGHTTYI